MKEYTEYIGYLASGLVLLSFLMKEMTTLRLVNILGCLAFVAYGILLNSWPIIITNVAISCVNTFYLIKSYREKTNTAG
jgi:hypothetical protein